MARITVSVSDCQKFRDAFGNRLRQADGTVVVTVNVQVAALSRRGCEPLGWDCSVYRRRLSSSHAVGKRLFEALSQKLFILFGRVRPARVTRIMGRFGIGHENRIRRGSQILTAR